ncbi:hypothetical protein JW992_06480 [candidate division KSB1 bacterium]|nr:hypothetical protein [candidate division KSB1 bacterium]
MKNKFIKILLKILLTVVFLASAVQGQTFTIDPSIVAPVPAGPRAAAMGRAFTAIADDGTALAWNPAGLAEIKENRAVVSGALNFGSIDPQMPSALQDFDFDVNQGSSASLNYIGFTIPIPIDDSDLRLVSSIAMRNIRDFGNKLTYTFYQQNSNLQLDDVIEQIGGLFSLSGGMGIAVFDNLYLGASLNLLSGKDERRNEQFTITPDTTLLVGREIWKNKFSGYQIETGFIWRMNDFFSLGGCVQFPHTIHYNKIRLIDTNDQETELDTEVSIAMPMRYTIGLALKMSKNLTFATDYSRRPWNTARIVMGESEQDRFFSNSNSFHMGFEYLAGHEEFRVPIRFGFFNQPEQLYEFDPAAPDARGNQISSHSITAGSGIHFQRVHFDLSLQYRFYSYRDDYLAFEDDPVELNISKFNVMAALEFSL